MPNFLWSLHGMRGMKICSNVPGHLTMPMYGEKLQKSFSLEPRGWWLWNLVYSIWYSSTTNVFVWLPWVDLDYFQKTGIAGFSWLSSATCSSYPRNRQFYCNFRTLPGNLPISVYRKDRNTHGGGVMLLVHKDISHMPITELENDTESIWRKVFANKTSHFVASWCRLPGSTSEEFQLFREQLDYIRTHHKGKKLPSAHVLGDFNFKDIDWPDRLSKSGSTLSQSEGQILIDIMNDTLPHSRKEHIGLDSHHSTWSVSRCPLPSQT